MHPSENQLAELKVKKLHTIACPTLKNGGNNVEIGHHNQSWMRYKFYVV